MEATGVLRMDEINKLKKDFNKGDNKNKIAKKFNRSWDTVDNIVNATSDQLKERGKRPNRKPKVATKEVKNEVYKLLKQEQFLKIKKKQRYTAKFIFEELFRKNIYKGKDRTIRDVVKEIREELKINKKNSYLPLSFEAGKFIQIDHGEVDCLIETERITGYLFVVSLPGLTLRYCQMYPIKAQQAWGTFHEKAFNYFGGIFSEATYDNDCVLVKKVLGTEHRQTDFSLSLEEHYGFSSIFCNRGAGNEKGSVENAVGFCRRNYLAGLPKFSSWTEINYYLETKCTEEILKGKHYRTGEELSTILANAKGNLLPIPPEREWVKWFDCGVNSYQVVINDNHWYSVPERYVGSNVRVAVGVFKVSIYKDYELIAMHSRKYLPGDDSLQLDHYLDQLIKKPGALWDCTAVKKHKFESELIKLWNRLYSRMEKRQANKELIKILLLKRIHSYEDWKTAIGLALLYGSVEYAGVVNILNQLKTDSIPRYDEKWLDNYLPELQGRTYKPTYDLSLYATLHREV